MRWLLLILLFSLLGLLIAVWGMAHHIWLQRDRLRSKPPAGKTTAPGPAEETDVETER